MAHTPSVCLYGESQIPIITVPQLLSIPTPLLRPFHSAFCALKRPTATPDSSTPHAVIPPPRLSREVNLMFEEWLARPHLLTPEPRFCPSFQRKLSSEKRIWPLIVTCAIAALGTTNAPATASAINLRCMQKLLFGFADSWRPGPEAPPLSSFRKLGTKYALSPPF